ncbi:hypothetical protein AJ80_09494 [Polytolypa hystricis UAMH7299]|uniref:Myb-like domain-containing protein n=1 Tax=Polytolypa hystricis (strain UAMH7299) TaxID=1447883 RepID=A0A2B7WQ88_POLH7|nr:hypothetical protein AJ80_09494 [Polytolypa hystricis UAMH7299]
MSVNRDASERRDMYDPEEERLLQQLKQSHPNAYWHQLITLFNSSVPAHRRRTADGIKNKWKDMENIKKDDTLLRELKLAQPQADWPEVVQLFNQLVPARRNKSATALRLKWENMQQHPSHDEGVSSQQSPWCGPENAEQYALARSNVSIYAKESDRGYIGHESVSKSDHAAEREVETIEDRCLALESEPWFQEFCDSIDPDTVPNCLIDPALRDQEYRRKPPR